MHVNDSPWALPDRFATVEVTVLGVEGQQAWCPGPQEAHLHGWYLPFLRFVTMVHETVGWRIDLESVRFHGRVFTRGTDLWWYRSDRNHAELALDERGFPHRLRADRRCRSGYRFEPVRLETAADPLVYPLPTDDEWGGAGGWDERDDGCPPPERRSRTWTAPTDDLPDLPNGGNVLPFRRR